MKKVILLSFIALATVLTSCSKYDDGPAFSLLTKKHRITGDYNTAHYFENGTDLANSEDITWSFEKSGECSVTIGGDRILGTWELVDNKEDLRINWESGAFVQAEIKKLTNAEFWFSDNAEGVRIELFKK